MALRPGIDLEALLRALVDDEPIVVSDEYSSYCAYCLVPAEWDTAARSERPVEHDDTCPWRQAKEALAPIPEWHQDG